MENKIVLINRESLNISGIQKVISSSDSQIQLEVDGSCLVVSGLGLSTKSLSVENGVIAIDGKINELKFTDKKQKGGLLKRIFK